MVIAIIEKTYRENSEIPENIIQVFLNFLEIKNIAIIVPGNRLYGKLLFTWLSLACDVYDGVFFVLSFFPRGVLDEILNLIESVSEGFSSYSYSYQDMFSENFKLSRYISYIYIHISFELSR